MDEAAKKFIGSHDFRNFCKMDLQKSNFVREVQSVTFSRCSNSQSCWVATIQGRSFLWHQVRSMMSLLFMIGYGQEEPQIIETLLDIDKTPEKPLYNIADPGGLVLYDCLYDNFSFDKDSETGECACSQFESHRAVTIRNLAILNCMSQQSEICEDHHWSVIAHLTKSVRPRRRVIHTLQF
eukprot:Filipodium_phascolosomae@DN5845_c0_g1_i1.p1